MDEVKLEAQRNGALDGVPVNAGPLNGASLGDCLSDEVIAYAANGHRPPPLEKQGVDAISILDYVGNTPLFKFCSITRHLQNVQLYAKAEYLNPAGSVKDRPALSMILKGEREGALTKDKIILDSTSGNTGIAYAMIGAARGYKVQLVMPGNVSPERKAIVKMYGAELVLSDPMKGSDGAIEHARALYAENPHKYFKPDQYNNEANSLAHFNGTGPEIWKQTRGKITHFLATIGTSGTVMGTSRFLKTQNEDIECIAVEPDNAMHGIEGLKHMETSIQPGIYHPSEFNRVMPVETEDAYDMQKRLAREEGIFVGFSAGAGVWAALKTANELEAQGREAVVVTILCDRGDRYLHQLSMLNE
jgi:cysteine synthase B